MPPTAADAAAVRNAPAPDYRLLAWPVVDGYSDPNLVVYDQAHFDSYMSYHSGVKVISCGIVVRQMTSRGSTDEFTTGIYGDGIGYRFQLDQLRKFLRGRIDGTAQAYSDAEALRLQPVWLSPYELDVYHCVKLVGDAKAKDAVPELKELLADPSEKIQRQTLWAVYGLGPDAAECADRVIALLETDSLARDASLALAAIGKAAIPALVAKVNGGGVDARIYSIDALGKIGPDASAAVEELIKALHEKKDTHGHSGCISSYAAEALGHIRDRRALPHLRQMTTAKNHDVRDLSEAAIVEIEGGPSYERR